MQEKVMVPHSSTLAWKTPWMEEPGRLQSKGSLRVGYDWASSLSLFTSMHWRRKWQPTPVLLPGEFQGQGSLVGCRLWGRTGSDTTEVLEQQQQQKSSRAMIKQMPVDDWIKTKFSTLSAALTAAHPSFTLQYWYMECIHELFPWFSATLFLF